MRGGGVLECSFVCFHYFISFVFANFATLTPLLCKEMI